MGREMLAEDPKPVLLSIVMPAHLDRWRTIPKIVEQITAQIGDSAQIEFLVLLDNGSETIGTKMNWLYNSARGQWVAAVADDDLVSADYVEQLVEACLSADDDAHVISFDHTYYVNGEYRALVKVGTEYEKERNDWVEKVLTRYPSSLCAIRKRVAAHFPHPDISDKENVAFIEYLKRNKLREVHLDRVLYHHMWNEPNEEWRRQVARRWGRKVG